MLQINNDSTFEKAVMVTMRLLKIAHNFIIDDYFEKISHQG